MTAIAALRTKKNVIIGADSAGVSGWDLTLRKDKKIFRVGRFVIGSSGSIRMRQLLLFDKGEDTIRKLIPKGNSYKFMVTVFVPAVREIFSKGGLTKIEHSRETIDGHFVVAWERNLFVVEGDFQVEEPLADYAACGCGENYVIGSLYTSRGAPRKRVLTALKCAERHIAGVRGPFRVLET